MTSVLAASTAAAEAPVAAPSGAAANAEARAPEAVKPADPKAEAALPPAPEPRAPDGAAKGADPRDPLPDLLAPAPAVEGKEDIGMGWALFKTLLVLCIVILSAYLTLNFGLRRLMGITTGAQANQVMSVVARVPVDAKKSLLLVRAAGEHFLVGSGETGLSFLAKLDGAEVEKALAAQPSGSLSPFLQKLVARRGSEVAAAPAAPVDTGAPKT